MTTEYEIVEGSDQIRPVQFLSRGESEQLPVPFIRVTTCGLLTVEAVAEVVSRDPPLARYVSLTPEQLHGRGTVPAFMLLKLLLNRHERFATREWLMEQFCHDRELFASVRIGNVVSQLRGLLCPPDSQYLRKHLVTHVRGSSGDGYQLAPHPLVWVDQDALTWNVEQATRMERFGDHALPFWERAYELARRGPYLPDERYADWASFQREQAASLLRQSVLALARLYQAHHGVAGEEEAALLLRTYWLEHPHEEDALRPLMELLGRRECMHEALGYYKQLCDLLQEDEREPDSQTQDVAQYLRNKQIQRPQKRDDLPRDQAVFQTPFPFSPDQQQGIMQETASHLGALDMDTLRRTLVQSLLGLTVTTVVAPCDADLLDRFSRLLIKPSSLNETVLAELENRTSFYWQHRLQATFSSPILLEHARVHFSLLLQLLQGSLSSSERQRLCAIGSETAQIIGMLFFDLHAYSQARHYFQAAIRAAQEAQHSLLEIVAWGNLSFAWTYDKHPQDALPCIQKGRMLMLAHRHISPMIQGEFASREAEVLSLLGQRDDCLSALEDAGKWVQSAEPSALSFGIHFDAARWDGYQGACFRHLYSPEKQETYAFLPQAEQVLKTALQQVSPSQSLRRSTLELDLAEVYLHQKDIEAASLHALQAALITGRTGSHMMTQRLQIFRQKISESSSSSVQLLDHQLTQLARPEAMRQMNV